MAALSHLWQKLTGSDETATRRRAKPSVSPSSTPSRPMDPTGDDDGKRTPGDLLPADLRGAQMKPAQTDRPPRADAEELPSPTAEDEAAPVTPREPVLMRTRRPTSRTTAATSPDADGLTLGGLAAALWRSKIGIVSFTGLCALVALAVLLSMRPRYEANVRLLVEPAASIVPSGAAQTSQTGRERVVLDAEAVASQVELVRSRDVAMRVIEELDLTSRLEFATPGAFESLLAVLGKAPDEASLTDQAMKTYANSLRAFHVPDTRVIGITFRSVDPELAARGADAVARAYLAEQVLDKSMAAEAATDWLGEEITELRFRLAEAERRVQAFRAEAGLIRGANDVTLPAQRLSELNTQLARARALRIDAEGKAEQLRRALRTGTGDGLVDAVDAPLMQRLMERQADVRGQLADVSTTLGPAHPRVKQLNAQLSDLDGQVRAEARRLAAQFDEDARTAQARERTLLAELASLQGEAADAEFQDVELRALEREAKAQRDLLETLLGRYREASASQNPAAQPADARIVSSAAVPLNPAFPKTGPTLLAIVVGAFVLACGVVLAGAFLNQAPAVPSRGRHDRIEPEGPMLAAPAADAGEPITSPRGYAEPVVTAVSPRAVDEASMPAADGDMSVDEDANPDAKPDAAFAEDGADGVGTEDEPAGSVDGEAAPAPAAPAPAAPAPAPAAASEDDPERGSAKPFSQDQALEALSASLNVPIAKEAEGKPLARTAAPQDSLDTIAHRFGAQADARPRIVVVAPGAPVAAMTGLVLADGLAALGLGTVCIDAGTHAPGRRLEDLLRAVPGGLAGSDDTASLVGVSDIARGADIGDAVRSIPGSATHAVLGGTTRPSIGIAADLIGLLDRVYEAVVVIADGRDLGNVGALPLDAAVLVSDGCDEAEVGAALRALTAAGIADVTITSSETAVTALKDAA